MNNHTPPTGDQKEGTWWCAKGHQCSRMKTVCSVCGLSINDDGLVPADHQKPSEWILERMKKYEENSGKPYQYYSFEAITDFLDSHFPTQP